MSITDKQKISAILKADVFVVTQLQGVSFVTDEINKNTYLITNMNGTFFITDKFEEDSYFATNIQGTSFLFKQKT